jgi:hypothetical protein
MLIEDGKLNIEDFKKLFSSITWTKLPRNLGVNHKEYFYSGKYENPEMVVSVTIRPSMNMAISESFKNRMPMDGSIPPDGYRGPLVNWGSSVELMVDENFIKEVDNVAGQLMNKTIQKLEW